MHHGIALVPRRVSLLVLPDKKRADSVDFSKYDFIIKIDHHPFIEDFGGLECINDKASSAAEIIMDLLENTKLECNKQIAETLSITPQSVYRKVNGINEWKGSEITRIVEMLDLSREESDAIFFGKKVDFKSTTGCYDK